MIQQNAMVVGCEEMRGPVGVSLTDRKNGSGLVCPKPKRVGFLGGGNLTMSLRWQISQQSEVCDSNAGAELLDLILMKEGHGEGKSSLRELASSPPFFCGSPPSRVSNPIVQDAQFGNKNSSPLSTLQLTSSPSTCASPSQSLSPSSMKSGGVRVMKFGLKSPTIRVEGFDCLCRDHQNSRISTMA